MPVLSSFIRLIYNFGAKTRYALDIGWEKQKRHTQTNLSSTHKIKLHKPNLSINCQQFNSNNIPLPTQRISHIHLYKHTIIHHILRMHIIREQDIKY